MLPRCTSSKSSAATHDRRCFASLLSSIECFQSCKMGWQVVAHAYTEPCADRVEAFACVPRPFEFFILLFQLG